MTNPIRLTVAMTHPVQYYSPWFHHIAASCPEIALTVVYAVRPTPAQQGTGFGASFEWDTPLMAGYDTRVVREARNDDRFGADSFFGLNVSGMGRAVVETAPEAVLVPGWNSVSLVRAVVASRRERIPVLYRGDSQFVPRRNVVVNAAGQKTRLLIQLFTHYLAVGQRSHEYLKHFGVRDSRIFFSPHSVDNDFFARISEPYHAPVERAEARAGLGIPADHFVVLYVGKLEEKKHVVDVIAAVAALGSAVSLLIVGSGKEESRCRKAAREHGINSVFAGFTNQSSLGLPYAVADCLVLPSDYGETWGLVVNEAMATGLPCVVSRAAGCSPDMIVEGKTGFSFPLGDIPALSKALDLIRANLKRGGSFYHACRNHVARYSFTAATEGLVAACSSALRRNEGKGSPSAHPYDPTTQQSRNYF